MDTDEVDVPVEGALPHPCPHPAVVEIWGIPFCERGAREPAAYFAIGEITQELTVDQATLNKLLIEPKGFVSAEGGIRSGQASPGLPGTSENMGP